VTVSPLAKHSLAGLLECDMGEHYSMCIQCGERKGRHTHPTFSGDVLCDDCAIEEYALEVEQAQRALDEIKADIKNRTPRKLN